MNALESASLVMIPSGYEDGTLGSLKPTDGTGDFTFTRGSNISATRVNADGYIEKGYENLLLQSNTFSDAAWSSSNFTLTPNQSGYDGSTDAWKAQVSTTYNSLSQNFGGSGVYTFSGYFRKGDSNEGIRFNFSASTDTNVYVDLTDGSSTFNGTLIERSITDVGNGFYKVVVTANLTNPNSVRIFVTNGGTTTIAGNIYIQDAMLNQGMVSYPYVETTTAPVAGGILEDMPRLDYSNGSCPSLLLEPSRTNKFNHSEALYQLPVKAGVSWQDNVTISPEGLQNAGKLTEGTGFQYLAQSSLLGANRVISVFAKYDNSLTRIVLGQYITTNQIANAVFNIQTGTILSETTGSSNVMILEDAGVEDYGNGWRRYWVSVSGSNGVAYVGPSNSDTISFIPNYTGSGQHCFLYGFQYEQDANYPTSYIPTYGVSQTRLADVCVNAGDVNTFNNNEGILYAEVEPLTNGSDVGVLSLRGTGGVQTGLLTLKFNYASNSLQYFIYNQNVLEFNRSVSFNLNQKIKVAAKYSIGECALYINGVKQYGITGFTGFAPNTLQDVSFNTFSAEYLEANINQVLYFPTALSDEACIELTTI